MRNECNIVRDILPLYIEDMVSEDTEAFVRDHIAHCPGCYEEWDRMKSPAQPEPKLEVAPLIKLKKNLFIKKVQTVLLTVLMVVTFVTAVFSYLTAPQYFPYTSELLSVTENADGTVTVEFDDQVTGFSLDETPSPESDKIIYTLEAWTTTWDHFFQKRGTPNAILGKNEHQPFSVYYSQNSSENGHTAENIFLYGSSVNSCGGMISLPGLSLGYLLVIAACLFAVLGIIWIIFRKKQKIRRWIEKILYLPMSYGIGHIFVLGFRFTSYSEIRDFSLIVVIGTLAYGVFLLGDGIYHLHQEIKRTEELQ